MTSGVWWQSTELWATLLGVVVGFILAEVKEWRARRQRRRTHYSALRAEIEFCRRLAETYVRDRVIAPLYRLPTMAYSQSFPALLSDAAVPETGVESLLQFFSQVDTLNRGLELAQTARESDNDRAQVEFERNLLKAQKLIESYYQPARAVVDGR